MNKRIELNENWRFSLATANNTNTPLGTKLLKIKRDAIVPGTIHTDLLRHKLIPEPFYHDNELQLQWISECDWIYETTFSTPKDFDRNSPVQLVFDGIDTVADIFVNGVLMGQTENMFRSYSFQINTVLRETRNTLLIHIKSPSKYAKALEQHHGKLPVALNSERVYIRKAQYAFGWDWGPTFATSGIWKKVFLENSNRAAISGLFLLTKSITTETAEIEICVELTEVAPEAAKIAITLSDDTAVAASIVLPVSGEKNITVPVTLRNPQLWYPAGYGNPFLYTMHAEYSVNNELVSDKQIKTGIRTIELQVQEHGKQTFKFIVNGIPVYAKGANWIPAHSFLTEVSKQDYRKLIQQAADAHMNMLRVWGGGVYEQDVFYSLCDEYGLLVWQDFMFACAAYPEHTELKQNIITEAEQSIRRLREHPSLAVWCGNNECEWNWYKEQHESYSTMPGHSYFAKILPALVAEYSPGTPYWISTPFGSEADPNSMDSGNRHQWDVWSAFIDYTEVKNDTSLFVTEFGFQGPANAETLSRCLPKSQRTPQSKGFEFHNKQVEGNERLIKFFAGHLPLHTGWHEFIYLAQLNQGFAMKECLEHWRLLWPHTNGSIIWQLNDCWPVTSWSLIDSSQIPKLAYYFVKNAFVTTGVFFRKCGDSLELVGSNFSDNKMTGRVEVHGIRSGKQKMLSHYNASISMQSSTNTILKTFDCRKEAEQADIYLATFYDESGKMVHRNFVVMQKWKYLSLPKESFTQGKAKNAPEGKIRLKALTPLFFIEIPEGKYSLQDRGKILLPGETIEIEDPEKSGVVENIHTLNRYLL